MAALQSAKNSTHFSRLISMDGQKARWLYGLSTKREINLVMMCAIANAMIGFALGRIEVAPLEEFRVA